MNVSRGSTVLALAIAIVSSATPGTAQQSAPADLKWTPHRASTAATVGEVPAAASRAEAEQPATPAAATPAAPAPAPAPRPAASSVVLPEGVPAVPRSSVASAAPAARRPVPQAGPFDRAPPPAPAFSRAFSTESAAALFGSSLMRSPQGDVARPILAPEGRQAVAMQRRVEARSAATDGRLGGGLAPRFDPVSAASSRPERLAMNVDALPSVMLQQPQADALDAPAAPGREAPAAAPETLPAPAMGGASVGPDADGRIIERMPTDDGMVGGGWDGAPPPGDNGLLLGEYPAQLHVESFYDDPYECEDEECMLPFCHHGLICDWLRRFGKPYYGWRWYRDLTASAGITAFTNETDLGINGNFGTNEYLNWAMPFWNAFGIGWQVGWRGVQTNFQPVTVGGIVDKNARDQNFVTTGFFTRAFEGRGLQFGAVYDYLSDSWFDNTDVSQLRAEISYVWGYHEAGFWSATNIGDQVGIFGPITPATGTASTIDQYCGFYRLQFGDANEWKVWGGGTGDGHGIVGSMMRAPLARSWALEGTFTYVIPGNTRTVDIDGAGTTVEFAPSAWNVGVNVVFYPAGRSRRSLASPYRPLFEVADNGSMIRTITP